MFKQEVSDFGAPAVSVLFWKKVEEMNVKGEEKNKKTKNKKTKQKRTPEAKEEEEVLGGAAVRLSSRMSRA